jgi:hypothetical protein
MSIDTKIKYKSFIVNLLLLIFLTHGILYFLYPDDIYNLSSPIRYLKYIAIFLIVVVSLNETKKYKMALFTFITAILFALNLLAVGQNFDTILFINHIFPMIMFFFYDGLSKYISAHKLTIITYIVMTIMGYVEYLFLRGLFSLFADSGYRIVSIFVNPNNLGLVIIVLSVYILGENILKNKVFKILFILNSFLLIFLSGSRNSMLIFSTYLLLIILYWLFKIIRNGLSKKNVYFIYGFILFVVLFLVFNNGIISNAIESLLSTTRSLTSTNFFQGRLIQYSGFLDNVKVDLFFPLKNGFVYTDNLYFHIWGTFGLITLLFFLVFNLYLLIRIIRENKLVHFALLILLLLAGIAENLIYFWPVGYFYWYLVADIIKKPQANIISGKVERT